MLAPENTLYAFNLAMDHLADVLEIDVRISRDNQVVVTHDEKLDRTTNGIGAVRASSWRQLSGLDAGYRTRSIHGERFRGQGIKLLTLDELFDALPSVPINIDIKDKDKFAAELVADLVHRHQREHNTTVASFHAEITRYFRHIAPGVPTAATKPEVARLYFSRAVNRPSRDYQAIQIPVSWKLIPLATQRFIERSKSEGTEVCFWTINKPRRMRQLLALGADGIVTDRVDLARTVFEEYRTLILDQAN